MNKHKLLNLSNTHPVAYVYLLTQPMYMYYYYEQLNLNVIHEERKMLSAL